MPAFANFLNPALVWLAVGALAPIIIHLAARSRPKLTPFPAVRFIMISHRRTATKFRLKQLLLLLLRIAALGLFAFVVARPWVEGTAGDVRHAQATVTAVMVLDTSYSMGYRQDKSSSFEKAKEMALAAIGAFTVGESRACLVLAGDTPQPVLKDFDHAFDLAGLKSRIEETPLTWRGSDCTAAVKEAVRMLDGVSGAGKSVFLFTDLTACSWPGPVPAGGEDADEDVTIYVADAGPEEPLNPAVLAVESPDNALSGAPFEVRPRVDAVGSPGRQVELVIDGTVRDRKVVGSQRVEAVQLKASVTGRSPEHWGRVSLTGEDALPADNDRFFTFRSAAPVRAILVNGAPSAVRRRDELLYLRTALAPKGMAAGRLAEVAELGPADIESFEPRDADVLVLCNVGAISSAAWTRIRHFVSTGHGLMIFGGDGVRPEAYQMVSSGDTPLLPYAIGPARTPAEPTHLEPGLLKHPVLAKFRGGRNGDLAGARFTTYNRLEPGDEGAEIVLAYKNGDPALVAGRYGTGRVLVFASSCDADWNTLPREIPYGILIHESLRFLAASGKETRDVLVGSAPDVRITSAESAQSVTVARLPNGVPLDAAAWLDRRTGRLNLPAVDEPGAYRVEVGRGADKGAEEMFFAVNVDTAESDMERLPGGDEAVRSLLPGRTVKIARSPAELLDQVSRSRSVSEVTSHLAGIVLAILLAEMYLSNRLRTRAVGAEQAE